MIAVFPAGKLEMYWNWWTRNVPEWYIHSVPSIRPWCTPIGKFLGNLWKIVSTCWEHWKTWNILNVLTICHKFPKNSPIVVHLGRIDGTLWMYHSGTSLVHQFQSILSFPAGNTAIVQMGELQGKPWTIRLGTLQKHSLGTFLVFPGFSWWGHCGYIIRII